MSEKYEPRTRRPLKDWKPRWAQGAVPDCDDYDDIQKIALQSLKRAGLLAKLTIFALSLILYGISLTQRCYLIAGQIPEHSAPPGWLLLLIGWSGLFYGIFAWLANPILICSWWALLVKDNFNEVLAASILSLLFGLSFLLYREIPLDAGDNWARIAGYGWGYWLWLGSIATMIIAPRFVMAVIRSKEQELKRNAVCD